MKKFKDSLFGFTLVEMLVVMAIFVILAAMGAGAFAGIRETVTVKQNVESLKQDIQLAKQKAMLLEREPDENWLYGIGVDFRSVIENGDYKSFKWCSPYEEFGSEATNSSIPGYVEGKAIGDTVTASSVLGSSDIYAATSYCVINLPYCTSCAPGTPNCVLCDSRLRRCLSFSDPCTPILTPSCPYYTSCYPVIRSSCPYYEARCLSGDPQYNCDNYVPQLPPPPPTRPEVFSTFRNGILPSTNDSSTSCVSGQSSIVELSDFVSTGLTEGNIIIGTESNTAQFVVFEAVTGKAFLYDKDGRPVNYTYSGGSLIYDGSKVLDIIIERKRSSKFDLITVYPLSGAIIHHVYSSADIADASSTEKTFTFNGVRYSRYDISDELKSYREE